MNYLLLTYDSCRHDVLCAAATPVLDAWAHIHRAWAPASFTYASHQAFFVGMLPNVDGDLPFYNRFCKQLIGLADVGERQVVKEALDAVPSNWNIVQGFRDRGYQTIGAGAMDWFRQDSLTSGFDRFSFTGTDADRQIDFLRGNLDIARPFFGFINFGETHAPYTSKAQPRPCPVDVRARCMQWPPCQGEGAVGSASAAFDWQRAAAEFLDARLPQLFDGLPGETTVILTADHGDCFGEDGYWGHGVNHPKVFEVPLSIFRLDGKPLGTGIG